MVHSIRFSVGTIPRIGLIHFCIIVQLFFICTVSLGYASAKSYVNAECSMGQSRNYRGVCKRIQSCPAALSNLHAGVFPVTCLYEGTGGTGTRTPLICCESDPSSRISYKKCAEYSETARKNEDASATPAYLLPSNIPLSSTPTEEEGWGPKSLEAAKAIHPLLFVVGGSNARIGQFPYMAALGFSSNVKTPANSSPKISWLCGGTLISDQYVLTAAHCLHQQRGKGKPSFVLLGDINLNQDDSNNGIDSRIIIPIENYVNHPDYKSSSKHNDIGLIKLSEKVKLSGYVKPACLPQPVDRLEMNKTLLTATGWGLTEFAGSPSETLQFVELKRQNFSACVVAYSKKAETSYEEIITSQFCAGAGSEDDVPRDTCDGDSGSGLTMQGTLGNYNFRPRFVVGITSFGSKYCGLDKPGVYTNVQSFLDWIEDTVWSNTDTV